MADRQSYPSPTAAQTRAGAGPFYGNGGVSPPHGVKDISHNEVPQMQLGGEMENINPDLQGNGHQDHYAAAHDAHQQLAQSVMSLAHQPDPYQPVPTTAPSNQSAAASAAAAAAAAAAAKQRSKVSRACDECRRKKVTPILLSAFANPDVPTANNLIRYVVTRLLKMKRHRALHAKNRTKSVNFHGLRRNADHRKGV
jgi:hypothetical protein